MELVADSGFNINNALPLYNFGVENIEESGNCAGLDYLSMLSYKKSEILKGKTFTSVYIKNNNEKIRDLNLSSYDCILNGNASSYLPSSDELKSIYKTNSLNNDSNKIFLLDNLKSTDDYDLVKGILLLQLWVNKNFKYQTASSLSSFFGYTQESNCPSSELDLIKNELLKGNPVSVTVTNANGSGHNLIGYKLYQHKIYKNYYYLKVIDTNKIDEDNLFVIFSIREKQLYGIYSPSGLYAHNSYVYSKKIECSTYDGKLLHKTNVRNFIFNNWDKD